MRRRDADGDEKSPDGGAEDDGKEEEEKGEFDGSNHRSHRGFRERANARFKRHLGPKLHAAERVRELASERAGGRSRGGAALAHHSRQLFHRALLRHRGEPFARTHHGVAHLTA